MPKSPRRKSDGTRIPTAISNLKPTIILPKEKMIRSARVIGSKNIVTSGNQKLKSAKIDFPQSKKSKTSLEIQSTKSKTDIQKNVCPGKLSLISTNKSISTSGFELPKNHKLGELPSYIKRLHSSSGIDPMIATKRKSYLVCKRKVTDAQTEFLMALQNLEKTQFKIDANEKDFITLSRYQLMLISKERDGNGKLVMVSDQREIKIKECPIEQAQLFTLLRLKNVSENISRMVDSGYKLCKEIIDTIKTSKIVNSDQIGDGALGKSEVLRLLFTLEDKINVEMEANKDVLTDLLHTVDAVDVKQPIDKHELEKQVFELTEKIGQLKKNLEDNKLKAKNLEITVKELENSHALAKQNLEAELDKQNKEICCKNENISKLKNILNSTEEFKNRANLKNETLINELMDSRSKTLILENKVEQLRKKSDNNIAGNLDELKSKEIELQKLLETERERYKLLEIKLKEIEKKLEEANNNNPNERFDHQLWSEFQKLKMNYDKINYEKEALIKTLLNSTNDDVTHLKNNLVKAHMQIQQFENANKNLLDNIKELTVQLKKKKNSSKEEDETVVSTNIKNYQNEINTLRETVIDKETEIESLKYELTKYRLENKQQEETVYMHTRLLRIRSELINSLQEKEASTRCNLEDLYSEISKKTNLINQMNREISAKAEELQNLFSTLGSKETELTRQETIIKMLEENDTRNQKLRVKQEEKIARLEHENSELKHVVSICQELCPDLDFKENNKYSSEVKSSMSREFFIQERCRKRQVEIEVKQIEKY